MLHVLMYVHVKSFMSRRSFLDFLKPLDRVPHKRLIAKLASLKRDKQVFKVIESFLSNRLRYTAINTHESALRNVTSWVPQCTILATLLFLI